VLRTRNVQPSWWESVLPEVCLRVPTETGTSRCVVGRRTVLRPVRAGGFGVVRVGGRTDSAKNKTDTSAAGQAAVEYEYGYESQPGHYFDFLSGSRLYHVALLGGNERSSENHEAFLAIAKSLKFK
jgi:hypothetical protein